MPIYALLIFYKTGLYIFFNGQSDGRLDPVRGSQRALKSKLAQGGPSGSNPLRSDGSHDGHAGGWAPLEVANDTKGRVGKQL